MNTKRLVWSLNIALVLSLLVVGCKPPEQEIVTATREPTETPVAIKEGYIRIGFAGPLEEPQGASALVAAEMAIRTANSLGGVVIGDTHYTFELVAMSDFGDPDTAANVAENLIAEGAVAVVGHLTSDTSIAAAPVYAEYGVPQISPWTLSPEYTATGYPTVFRMSPNVASLGPSGAWVAYEMFEWENVVLVHADGTWETDIVKSFADRFQNYGEVLYDFVTTRSDPDWTNLLDVVSSEEIIDGLVFAGEPSVGAALIWQAEEQGVVLPPILSLSGLDHPGFLEEVGTVYEVFSMTPGRVWEHDPNWGEFVDEYAAIGGSVDQITSHTFFAFDAAAAVITAVELSGRTDPAHLLKAMEEFRSEDRVFSGASGDIAFDEWGDARIQAYSLSVAEDGAWRPIFSVGFEGDELVELNYPVRSATLEGQTHRVSGLASVLAMPGPGVFGCKVGKQRYRGGNMTAMSVTVLDEDTECHSWWGKKFCSCNYQVTRTCSASSTDKVDKEECVSVSLLLNVWRRITTGSTTLVYSKTTVEYWPSTLLIPGSTYACSTDADCRGATGICSTSASLLLGSTCRSWSDP